MHLFLSNGQLQITAEKLSVWIRLYPQLQAYRNNDICPLQVQRSWICLKNLKDAHWLIKYRKKSKEIRKFLHQQNIILLIIFRRILNILIINNKKWFLHVSSCVWNVRASVYRLVCRWNEVDVGKGEGDVNVCCIIYRFSSMSMLCAHFPVTFQRLRKKATKQCNGEKDLQHSTIELKEAWRMKQTPRLPLTIPFLTTYLCSLVCRSHVQETGNAVGPLCNTRSS